MIHSSRIAVAHALVRAVSRLVSTPGELKFAAAS
jgi:hypothetical protein